MKKRIVLMAAVATASLLVRTAFAEEVSWDGAFDAPPAPVEEAVFEEEAATDDEGFFSEGDAIIEESTVDEEFAYEQIDFFEEEEATASFDEEETVSETSAMAAEGLVYTGEPQALIVNTSPDDGNLYSLDGENFSSEIPTATNAGQYTVYIMNNTGDVLETVTVVIEKADVIFTPPVPNTTNLE